MASLTHAPDLRYITSRTLEASSLFFSSGTVFTDSGQDKGQYRMMKADKR